MKKSKITGERIRERRLNMDLTQEQLAARTGYTSKSAISRIESGKSDLNQTKIRMFAIVLNTTPQFLMGWTDNPSPELSASENLKAIANEWENIKIAYDASDERTKKMVRMMLGLDE